MLPQEKSYLTFYDVVWQVFIVYVLMPTLVFICLRRLHSLNVNSMNNSMQLKYQEVIDLDQRELIQDNL